MLKKKQSKNEWIGDIPIKWNEKPIRYVFNEIKEKNKLGLVTKALKFTYGKIIPKTDFDADEDNYVANTILTYNIVSPGTIMINCLNLNYDFVSQRIGLVKDNGVITSAYLPIKPINDNVIDSEYANYQLKAWDNVKAFHNMGSGVRKTLDFNELGKKYILLPPIEMQKRIVSYLNLKCAEIDALHTDIEKQIETLEEYKKSIITEAVTKGLDPDVEMKDSGIEWIGMIPKHWDVHPVYSYFGERKNRNKLGKETNLLSLSYGNIIRKDINTNGGLLPENFNNYNIVEANDIIIRPTDLQNDKHSLRTGLVTEHGIITSAYIDLYPQKDVNSKFFHYLLHAYDLMKVFYNMGNGVRQGLNYSEFSRLMVYFPLPNEQKEIVEYLNTKCAEIDGVIADKKKQLETLEQYKKSLIYEYVTGKKEVPDNE